MEKKPVYVINGFLDSGKSSFIAYTIGQPYFQIQGTTLLILCEEGEGEYRESLLKESGTVVEKIEDLEDFTPSRLMEFEKKYRPERVLIEWNGMWDFRQFKIPNAWPEGSAQMLVSSIDYNEYVGRIATGRIERGTFKKGMGLTVCHHHGLHAPYQAKVVNLFTIDGLKRVSVEEATAGDIVCVSGIEEATIGDTLCASGVEEPLPFVKISEPTLEMTFLVNDSPFAGTEGKFCTSRHLRARLYKELLKDVSLKVEDTDTTEAFRVMGRGEMHLSILIENMRREGYEFQVSAPKVLYKEEDGVTLEPLEEVSCDVPQEYMGSVIEKLGARKGELIDMAPRGDRMHVVFHIPTRGLFGYRNEFLTDTRGEGIINSIFHGYTPYKGEIAKRSTGSLVAYENGKTTSYGIFNVQDRGIMFVVASQDVYEGQIVGENAKSDDIVVNVCKKKHLTAIRSSGADEALRLIPPKIHSLEEAIEFINDDELIEVTPKSIRLRKSILNNVNRAKFNAKK